MLDVSCWDCPLDLLILIALFALEIAGNQLPLFSTSRVAPKSAAAPTTKTAQISPFLISCSSNGCAYSVTEDEGTIWRKVTESELSLLADHFEVPR